MPRQLQQSAFHVAELRTKSAEFREAVPLRAFRMSTRGCTRGRHNQRIDHKARSPSLRHAISFKFIGVRSLPQPCLCVGNLVLSGETPKQNTRTVHQMTVGVLVLINLRRAEPPKARRVDRIVGILGFVMTRACQNDSRRGTQLSTNLVEFVFPECSVISFYPHKISQWVKTTNTMPLIFTS